MATLWLTRLDRCSHLERGLQTEVLGGEEVVKRDGSDGVLSIEPAFTL
jgi:hypothetical protein